MKCKSLENVTSMVLEQRHVVKFLHLKDLKLCKITTELSSAYGQDADTSPSIKEWIYQVRLERMDDQAQHVGERPTSDNLDTENLAFL
jgi:hypothetical protein